MIKNDDSYMSMTRGHCQEDLSSAYILAVAAKAGFNCGPFSGHDYGVDTIISFVDIIDNHMLTSHPLYIQVKATYNFTEDDVDNCIIYDLDVKTYNMLIREDRGFPIILILYCMPRDDNEWLLVNEQNTTLKNCGYWASFRGETRSQNTSRCRIKIPKDQIFNELAIKSIMERIKTGGVP